MFVAGCYTGTFDSVAIDITEEGFDLDQTYFAEAIRGDNLGSSHQDAVYRGGNCFLSWINQEWNLTGSKRKIYWPWGSFGQVGQVGVLASSMAVQLVLTAVAGTNAAAQAGLVTFTAKKAILAADFNVKHTMSTRHRKVPVRHQLYPGTGYAVDSSGVRWFEGT